jgi:DNA modification methylase
MSQKQEIKFDSRNYRIHNEKNKQLISKSLKELGTGRSIIIDSENEIIEGNGVYAEAQKLNIPVKIIETNGKELIALKRTDLKTNDEKRKKLAILDNSTSDTSEFNMDMLTEDNTPEELAELGIEIETTDVPVEQIEEDDIPEEIQTRTQKGDLWKLGDHYLLCGDSTNKADIDRLMQGNIADMVMTDPPYNVNVKNSQGMKIQNDNMSTGAFSEFLNQLFEVMASVLKEGGAFYVFIADSNRLYFETSLIKNGLQVKQPLIWVKNCATFGRSDYHWQHEPILYGWKEGKKHYFIDEYNHTTVIEQLEKAAKEGFDKLSKEQALNLLKQIYSLPTTIIRENKPLKDENHPTQKPIRMLAKLIRNSSKPGEIVLDVCGGSGSTLMACEQLGRKCFINEIDPKYCDVILQRWEDFTKQKAELIKTNADN